MESFPRGRKQFSVASLSSHKTLRQNFCIINSLLTFPHDLNVTRGNFVNVFRKIFLSFAFAVEMETRVFSRNVHCWTFCRVCATNAAYRFTKHHECSFRRHVTRNAGRSKAFLLSCSMFFASLSGGLKAFELSCCYEMYERKNIFMLAYKIESDTKNNEISTIALLFHFKLWFSPL